MRIQSGQPALLVKDTTKLSFVHTESDFIDFKNEFLLPHRLSNLGPRMTVGDIDGDGLEDLYIGGAAGYTGVLYRQTGEGFQRIASQALDGDSLCEDGQSVMLDIDQDNDLDLMVVSGSNEFEDASPELQDRLYVNDGRGNFTKKRTSFADRYVSRIVCPECRLGPGRRSGCFHRRLYTSRRIRFADKIITASKRWWAIH